MLPNCSSSIVRRCGRWSRQQMTINIKRGSEYCERWNAEREPGRQSRGAEQSRATSGHTRRGWYKIPEWDIRESNMRQLELGLKCEGEFKMTANEHKAQAADGLIKEPKELLWRNTMSPSGASEQQRVSTFNIYFCAENSFRVLAQTRAAPSVSSWQLKRTQTGRRLQCCDSELSNIREQHRADQTWVRGLFSSATQWLIQLKKAEKLDLGFVIYAKKKPHTSSISVS